jgi:nitrogen regulatory protein PII
MKMIVAVVQPFRLSKVTHALEQIPGFPGVTIADVRGFGREKSVHEEGAPHRVIEDFVEYVKKTRLEIVAVDDMVDAIVETIGREAHTGNRGDGKIFVWRLETVVRVRTGETDDAAV